MTDAMPINNEPLVVQDLRCALIECGRAAGAFLTDEVSNEFLMLVPGEVKAKIEADRIKATSEAIERAAIADELGLRCDATGGLHNAMKQDGGYEFCPDCGMSLRRHVYTLPHVKPAQFRAAIRSLSIPGGEG